MQLDLATCGNDGQHWHGVLEQDGKTVEYETYYHAPSVGEKVSAGASVSQDCLLQVTANAAAYARLIWSGSAGPGSAVSVAVAGGG